MNLIERLEAYCAGIDGKNDLRVGLLMCRSIMQEAAEALKRPAEPRQVETTKTEYVVIRMDRTDEALLAAAPFNGTIEGSCGDLNSPLTPPKAMWLAMLDAAMERDYSLVEVAAKIIERHLPAVGGISWEENCRQMAQALAKAGLLFAAPRQAQAISQYGDSIELAEAEQRGFERGVSFVQQEGMMIVPVEPTNEMLHAGAMAKHSRACDDGFSIVGREPAEAAYRAMLAAAPQSHAPKHAGETK